MTEILNSQSLLLKALQIGIKNINHRIPYIEYGGCGLFTYHLNKHLKYNYNIDSEVVYISGPKCAINYDILFSHILLKIDNHVIDNNGIYEYNTSYKKIDITKLEEMIYIKELWNPKFYQGWFNCNFMYIDPKELLKEQIYDLVI